MCPVEEIGRNSVRPSTIPRINAVRRSMKSGPSGVWMIFRWQ
jgi:hypothetical protein